MSRVRGEREISFATLPDLSVFSAADPATLSLVACALAVFSNPVAWHSLAEWMRLQAVPAYQRGSLRDAIWRERRATTPGRVAPRKITSLACETYYPPGVAGLQPEVSKNGDPTAELVRRIEHAVRRDHADQSVQPKETDMPEYTMDIDGAPATNGDERNYTAGGDPGPYLRWHVQATRDGTFDAGTFSLRDRDSTDPISIEKGVVFDWPSSRTGWMLNQEGQAPIRRWNKSRTKFEPKPDKTNPWRRAIWMEIALDRDRRCLWEQPGESAWLSYCDLMMAIRDTAMKELPKLPLIAHVGQTELPMSRGNALLVQWKLLRYVPRPLSLPEHRSSDTGAAHPAHSGNGAITRHGGDLDDEIPF